MYVNVFLRHKFLLIYTWCMYRPSDFVTTPVYIQELMKTLGTWELAISPQRHTCVCISPDLHLVSVSPPCTLESKGQVPVSPGCVSCHMST